MLHPAFLPISSGFQSCQPTELPSVLLTSSASKPSSMQFPTLGMSFIQINPMHPLHLRALSRELLQGNLARCSQAMLDSSLLTIMHFPPFLHSIYQRCEEIKTGMPVYELQENREHSILYFQPLKKCLVGHGNIINIF